MTVLRWPDPPADFEGRVQAQVDEIEFHVASLGETTGYLSYAAHLDEELARNGGQSLVPADPAFWRAVAAECRRREAGEETIANRDRLRGLEE